MYKNMKILSLFLAVFCFASVAMAQETTGSIDGVVKDATGAVVPGISVTITSTGSTTGLRKNTTTRNDGSFSFRGISPGTYQVTTSGDKGFGSATVKNIVVSLGASTPVEVTVTAGGTAATVDIDATDSAQIDVTDSKIQTNVGQKEIDTVPGGTRFTSLLKVAPAVRVEPNAGGFQIDGASGSENTFVIDGQEVTNFRTGTLDGNNNLPFQIVQEVQIKSSGFAAEFGGATGGVINVVTKGGNNEFHGEASISFQPRKLSGDLRPLLLRYTADADATAQFEYFERRKDTGTNFFPSVTLGGPILKDRLWFFGSYSPQFFERDRVVPSFNQRDPNGRTIVQEDEYRSNTKQEYGFGRIDAAITDDIRINASFTWNPLDQEGTLPGTSSGLGGVGSIPSQAFPDGTVLVGPAFEDQTGGRQSANNTNIQGSWAISDKAIITARYGYGFLNQKLGNYGIPSDVSTPQYVCSTSSRILPGSTCTTGTSIGSRINALLFDVSTRKTFDVDGTFFVNFGNTRHTFKAGYQLNRLANDTVSQINPRFFFRFGDATNGATVSNFSGRPITSNPNAIGVGQLTRFGVFGDVSSDNQAIYIQDKFQIGQRLTISAGFRVEKEEVPGFNGFDGINFDFFDKFTPRLGFAFDLTGDGKNKIYANFGRFNDRFKYELPRGSFGGNFFRRDYFDLLPGTKPVFSITVADVLGSFTDPVGGECPAPGGIANPTGLSICQRDFRSPSNLGGDVLANGGIDPNLEPFQQTEFTVGYERQISRDYVFKSRYTHKQVDRAVEDLGFINTNGSEVFLIGNPGFNLAEQVFLDAGLTPAKANRDYDALELRLNKRLSNNYFFNASYTYSRLYGNYAGLASSDENGRTSPNVNRNFDSPISGFTASGAPDDGRLRTDRPHVVKISAGYEATWSGSNTTMFSAFQDIQSGVPETTNVTILGVGTIPLFGRGDLGRTDTFTNTDFKIRHEYKFGKSDRNLRIIAELDILNLFDETNSQSLFRGISTTQSFNESDFGFTDMTAFLRAFPTTSFANQILATINAPSGANASSVDPRYGLASSFQGGRSVRFSFRFLF